MSIDEAMSLDATGQHIVVLDHIGLPEVYTATDRLAAIAATVTLVTPMPTVAVNVGFTHIKDLNQRLYGAGVRPETSTTLSAVADGEMIARHVYSRAVLRVPADYVVLGIPATPNLELTGELDRRGIETIVVGDEVRLAGRCTRSATDPTPGPRSDMTVTTETTGARRICPCARPAAD